jgi:hypothetical protein
LVDNARARNITLAVRGTIGKWPRAVTARPEQERRRIATITGTRSTHSCCEVVVIATTRRDARGCQLALRGLWRARDCRPTFAEDPRNLSYEGRNQSSC